MKLRIFGLVFIVLALVLGYAITKQTLGFLAAYGWNESQCLVKKSDVIYTREEHTCSHSLEYQYEASGVKKTNSTWRLDPGQPYDWCRDVATFASGFPPNTALSCRVDPQNPDRAVLDRGNVLSFFKLLLPLAMLFFGIAMVTGKPALFPPSEGVVKRICQVVAAAMLSAGAFGTIYGGVMPMAESFDSSSWTKAQCEVLSSGQRITGTGSGPGSSKQNPGYYMAIIYTYALEGRNYVSDRYDFSWWGTGKSEKNTRIIEQHPIGAKVACWVNPDNPYEAVLVPGPLFKYLLGFIPAFLLPIGLGLWIAMRRLT